MSADRVLARRLAVSGAGTIDAAYGGAGGAVLALVVGVRPGRQPMTMAVDELPGPGRRERWVRRFGRRRRATTVSIVASSSSTGVLVERIGPLRLTFGAGPGGSETAARLALRCVAVGPWSTRRTAGLAVAVETDGRPSTESDRTWALTATVSVIVLHRWIAWLRYTATIGSGVPR